MEDSSSQLSDQNTLLKAQLAASGSTIATSVPTTTFPVPSAPAEILSNPTVLQQSGNPDVELLKRIEYLEAENVEKDAELERIRKDQDDLLELLTDQDIKLNTFKNRLRELGETIEDGDSDNNSVDSENES